MDLYKNIRSLREDRDLSQETIAKILACTQACYSKYELGKRNIPIESLIKLADYYETSVDYLLGLTEEKKPYSRVAKKGSKKTKRFGL